MLEPAKAHEKSALPAWQTWTHSEHIPQRHRMLFRKPTTDCLADRALAVLWNWTLWEYPGKGRLRAWLFGTSVETAERERRKLPKVRARFVAERLRGKVVELQGIIAELEAYAGEAKVDAKVPPRKKVNVVPPPLD